MSNDEPPSRSLTGWLQKLKNRFNREPQNREDLLDTLQLARDQALIDIDAQSMIEGVLAVSDLRVRDIMIPRAEMAMVERDDSLDQVLPVVIESAHSRFPVIGEDRAEVIGIMLAKDLLQYCGDKPKKFNMRDVVRNAVFVPESKRLNVLLKEFRTNRNHMAIVIDEYGTAAGLVTIEDVLEQIVGEIEDEYDFDDDVQILQRHEHEYTIKAKLDIDDFNDYFDADFSDEEFDTVGGLVTSAFGHLPKNGETVIIDRFEFRVIRADSRKIRLLAMRTEPGEA
ncbi:MAG: transporter associated domain-containing protein [Gammaproteobacteria bacterium]|jgi:magnesium and cobalt transporter